MKQIDIRGFQKAGVEIELKETILDSILSDNGIIYTYEHERVFSNGITLSPSIKGEGVYSFFGKEFPDFSLNSINGEAVSLSDYKGSPVFVNFWFTGCKPCAGEMPCLNKIKEKYGDKVVFLSVTFNSKEEAGLFFESNDFDFLHLTDAQKFIDEIGISSYPKNIIIDKEGKVHQILRGVLKKFDEEGNVVFGNGLEIIREIEKVI
jgi:thiol-disulfide isomerase/thioredoxin